MSRTKLRFRSLFQTAVDEVTSLSRGGIGASPSSQYTLQLSDEGKSITIETGGSIVIPSGVFSPGNVVMVFNNTDENAVIDISAVSAYFEGLTYSSIKLAPRGVGHIYFLGSNYCLLFGNFLPIITLEYFLVGGGGSAADNQPGGGGAGGLLQGTGLLIDAGTYYTITVGASAPGGYNSSTGNDTTAFGLTAKGGGRGGERNSSGGNGGSGGGKGFYNSNPGLGIAGQGYDGGGPGGNGASGGGGAGGPGVKGNSSGSGGSGGPGIYSDFDGTFRWYAGGGAPMSGSAGSGGGSSNYGGGGNASQGAGGPGIAIFKTARVAKLASVDPYVVGGLYVYKFTSSGSILF